jgi:hypothetical protein
LSQRKLVVAGPNTFQVRFCPDVDAVRLVEGSVSPKPNLYAAAIGQSGPPVVEITFTGPTTYHCFVSMQGGVISSQC